MAEGHSVVVRVIQGRVKSVAFCECCAPVIVEVRTYENPRKVSPRTRTDRQPFWPIDLGGGRMRDELGAFRTEYFEPDDH